MLLDEVETLSAEDEKVVKSNTKGCCGELLNGGANDSYEKYKDSDEQ